MLFNPERAPIFTGESLAALVVPPDHDILKPNLLGRGDHAVIGGLTGIGKSFVLLNMVRSFMDGSSPFGIPGWSAERSRVLYIDMELGKYMFSTRLKDGLFTMDELHEYGDRFQAMSKPRGINLSNPEVVKWLHDYCADQGIDVIMMDPISRMHTWEENSGGMLLVDAVEEISDGRIATIITHHFRKPLTGRDSENYDPKDQYNFRGNVGTRVIEDASFILTFVRHGIVSEPYEHWKLAASLQKTRHTGGNMKDFNLLVNWDNDRRVILETSDKRLIKPLPESEFKFGTEA